MLKLACITAVLLAVPTSVLAQTQTQPVPVPVAPANASKAKSDVDKVVCRSEDTIGSRLEARQVCMTRQQWQQYEAENRQKTQDLQGQSGLAQSH